MASTNHEIEASSVAVRELKARAEWWIIDWLSVERRRQRRRPQFLPIGGVTKGRTRNGRHGLHLFFLPSLCALKNTREPAVEQREKENEKKKKIRIVYRNEVVPLQQLWKRGKKTLPSWWVYFINVKRTTAQAATRSRLLLQAKRSYKFMVFWGRLFFFIILFFLLPTPPLRALSYRCPACLSSS